MEAAAGADRPEEQEEGADDEVVGDGDVRKTYRRAHRKEFTDKLVTNAMMEIIIFGSTGMDNVYLLLVIFFHRLLRDKKANPRPVGWLDHEYCIP